MKKTVSMILALSAVASMSVTAFAEETAAPVNNTDVLTQEAEKKMVITFGTETFEDLLLPGETYRFPLFIQEEGSDELVPLQDEHVKDYRFRAEIKSGKAAVSSFKMEKVDDAYVLEVKTEAGWPTKQTDVEGAVKLVEKSNGQTPATIEINFTVGYARMSDETLESAQNGEYVYVDSAAPVITKEQFDKLDKYADGEKVTFTNGRWRYEVRISGQEDLNMLHNERAIKEISTKYEDQNFKYVSFPAGPQFDFTGTFTVDVANDMDTFDGNFFVYRYYKGKLNKIDVNFDKEEETLSFDTKSLGRFVITDKEIPDGTVITEFAPETSDSTNDFQGAPDADKADKNEGSSNTNGGSNNSSSNSGSNSNSSIKPNPSTGSDDMIGFAAASALLALATAGVLAKKKNK